MPYTLAVEFKSTALGGMTLETVTATETEWTNEPAVAVMVIVAGDGVKGAVTRAARVSLEAVEEFAGEKLAVRPAGRPVTEKTGEPPNPFSGVTAISPVVKEPRITLIAEGETDNLKSGGGDTWRRRLSE
jgi:hypothetical protein